jgi:hypothetical protein
MKTLLITNLASTWLLMAILVIRPVWIRLEFRFNKNLPEIILWNYSRDQGRRLFNFLYK